jgi:hypothetical protein
MAKAKGSNKKKSSSVFGQTLVTAPGRVMFPHFDVAVPFENNPPKYSGMLILKDSETLDKLQKEINDVGTKAFGEAFLTDGKYYKPIVTGEEVMAKSEKARAELYEGNFRLLAKGAEDKEPPKCYLADKSLMPRRPGNEDDLKSIAQQFYAGCYARFAVTPFSFNVGNSIGVGLILKGVQFVKDGDRLGAADLDSVFAEDFGSDYEFEDETDSAFSEDAGDVSEINV